MFDVLQNGNFECVLGTFMIEWRHWRLCVYTEYVQGGYMSPCYVNITFMDARTRGLLKTQWEHDFPPYYLIRNLSSPLQCYRPNDRIECLC